MPNIHQKIKIHAKKHFHVNQLVYAVKKYPGRDSQYRYGQLLSCLVAMWWHSTPFLIWSHFLLPLGNLWSWLLIIDLTIWKPLSDPRSRLLTFLSGFPMWADSGWSTKTTHSQKIHSLKGKGSGAPFLVLPFQKEQRGAENVLKNVDRVQTLGCFTKENLGS